MTEDNIANFVITIQQFPNLVLFLVFLVAFTESLIIIGLIVPGAILMVAFGALIALDALAFWPTVFSAVCGAIVGDTLSYWLGKRYQNRLNTIWPLSRHPELIIRANNFFNKHGVKSIILSRFIGPLRPIIPAIAGMAEMPKKFFLSANISSAIFWAPLYLLPGLLFGLSIEIASEFASKFIFLIILLLFVILFSLWLSQRLYLFIKPHSEQLIIKLLTWSKRHPIAGQMPAAIFDASHHEVRGLSLLAIVIFVCALVLFIIHNTFILPYSFDTIDRLVYYSLQIFRSPPFDSLMLWFTYITSNSFIALLCFSIGVLLIIRHNLLALWHWLAAISFPLLLSPFLKNDLTTTLQTHLELQSLPSIVIISVIGFSTMLMSSGLSFRMQKVFFYISATSVLLVSLAQLYFALQVFSQVLFGLLVGIIWFGLLGIAYRRHIPDSKFTKFKKEYIYVLVLLLAYPGWQTITQPTLYKSSESYRVMGKDSWLESGWELLPVFRQDIYSQNIALFNFQWAGTEESIRSQLLQSGFSESKNSLKKFASWFLPDVKIDKYPVLPHIHKGVYETLRFYRNHGVKNEKKLTVIRLWRSSYQLKQNSPLMPLWFGNASYMEIKKHLGIQYLVTSNKTPDSTFEFFPEMIQDKKLKISERIIFNNKETKKLFLVH